MASPIQIVLNAENYDVAREPGGGGPKTDFFAHRDREFEQHKANLILQLETAAKALRNQPDTDIGHLKVILRREAWAKSHRPVNALFKGVDDALQPVLGWHPTLTEYEIKAVSAGEDAQGQVLVRCRRSSDEGPGALVVSGHGLSTNIIEASLDAYLVAINKLHGAEINGVAVAFANQRTERGLP